MIWSYLKLFSRKKLNWLLFAGLIFLQIMDFGNNRDENIGVIFMQARRVENFALFLTPMFFFWNYSAYQVCSEVKFLVRMDSPFSYTVWYLKLSLLNSLMYVFFSNFIFITANLIKLGDISGISNVLILALLQFIYYVNCALLYFLVVTNLHDKQPLGFLAVVFYGVWDFIANQFYRLYIPYFYISVSYVVGFPEYLNNQLLFLKSFAVLLGTCLALYGLCAILIKKKDFMEWGKSHG